MKNKVHSTTEAQPMASLSNSSWQNRKEVQIDPQTTKYGPKT